MTKTTVLVTGVGAKSVGGQIITCLNKVPDKYRIIATDASDFSVGLFEADTGYLIPKASDSKYLQTLLNICRNENVQVIIPGSHPEVVEISKNKHLFEAIGVIPIVSEYELIKIIDDKISQYLFLQSFGIRVPRFLVATDILPKNLPFDFPMIVKPSSDVGGSKNVYIIKNRSELEQILEIFKQTDTNFLIQEYIGDYKHEYTVGVLFDKQGDYIDAIVLKRRLNGLGLLSARTIDNKIFAISSGYTQGEIVEDKKIKDYCVKIGRLIGVKGPLNVQLRTDEKGVSVFEIHCRFSGSSPLRADVGFNEPDILIENFLYDKKFDHIDYRSNVVIMRKFENVIIPNDIHHKLINEKVVHKKISNGLVKTRNKAKGKIKLQTDIS